MGRPYTTRAVLQSAVSATGDGGTLDVSGLASVGFQVSGTFTATVTFEATINGADWFSLRAKNVATGAVAATATAAGGYVADCAGLALVRARVTWTSGTSVTITAYAGPEGAGADDVTLAVPSDQTALPTRPDRGTYTERSTTIASGGAAQEAMAANTSRKAFFLQNISSGDLWFSFVETAAVDSAGSVKLAPGASAFSSGGLVSTQAMSIIGATTGQKFTLWEG